MEIQYVYIKPRSQFGKQCIFDNWGPVVDENLAPNAELMSDYIFRDPCHAVAQKSTQLAVHEMQTCSATVRDNGMNHTEGGWPKEINFRDEEATTRFRRRVEKEDIWAPKLKALIEPMEHCVLQNNAVNIYENYFDDMIPTELMLPLGVRTVNVYADPQINVRPITNLSWSPDHGNRLAVSYCCMEFQKSTNLSPYSYIWDIENPNQAFMALKSFCPSVDIEFNPRDPSMLISGLMSGQVCYWDIRTGNVPVQISHLQYSHRNPANLALWINSKNNAEFFSASTDGLMMWWDVRKIREPTETLVMDLNNPQAGDAVKAIGISSMNFEPTMGTKFMVGLENGYVISGSRKGKNPAEKLALRFNCQYGPVVGLDRNPFSPKNFLTVGDWTARIWAEDTKESCLLSTPFYKELLTGGCWSTSRYSVFYLINLGGELQVWDLLVGMQKPVAVLRLCDVSLRAIKPQEEGKLIAVGNSAGNVYLIEPSEALTTNTKNDKPLMMSYLERDSRYEKAIDNRLKEVRLMQRVDYGAEVEVIQPTGKKNRGKDKGKGKGATKKEKTTVGDGNAAKKDEKMDKGKGKDKAKKRESKADEKEKKKGKGKKNYPDDPELAEAEIQYYAAIQKEIDKYAGIEDPDDQTKGLSVSSGEHAKKKKEEKKGDKEVGKKGGKKSPRKSNKFSDPGYVIVKKEPASVEEGDEERLKRLEVAEEARVAEEMSKPAETEDSDKNTESRRSPRSRQKPRTIKRTAIQPCDPSFVCDPKICCKDILASKSAEEEERAKVMLSDVETSPSDAKFGKIIGRLSVDVPPLKEYSAEEKEAILKEMNARPDVLDHEVRLAKKEIREDLERFRRARKFPQRERSVKEKTRVKEWPGEMEREEDEVEEQFSEEGEEEEEFSDEERSEPTSEKKTKTRSGISDPCSPKKVPISVYEVVAQSVKTNVKAELPESHYELDLGYKMRAAIEEIYPRISAAANIKIGALPELRTREPTPPDPSSDDLTKKKRKKKELKETK